MVHSLLPQPQVVVIFFEPFPFLKFSVIFTAIIIILFILQSVLLSFIPLLGVFVNELLLIMPFHPIFGFSTLVGFQDLLHLPHHNNHSHFHWSAFVVVGVHHHWSHRWHRPVLFLNGLLISVYFLMIYWYPSYWYQRLHLDPSFFLSSLFYHRLIDYQFVNRCWPMTCLIVWLGKHH